MHHGNFLNEATFSYTKTGSQSSLDTSFLLQSGNQHILLCMHVFVSSRMQNCHPVLWICVYSKILFSPVMIPINTYVTDIFRRSQFSAIHRIRGGSSHFPDDNFFLLQWHTPVDVHMCIPIISAHCANIEIDVFNWSTLTSLPAAAALLPYCCSRSTYVLI